MAKAVRCDCGYEAWADDADGLVAEVRRHASEVHGMALSLDEALLLTFRAELDAPVAPDESDPARGHDRRQTRTEEER